MKIDSLHNTKMPFCHCEIMIFSLFKRIPVFLNNSTLFTCLLYLIDHCAVVTAWIHGYLSENETLLHLFNCKVTEWRFHREKQNNLPKFNYSSSRLLQQNLFSATLRFKSKSQEMLKPNSYLLKALIFKKISCQP